MEEIANGIKVYLFHNKAPDHSPGISQESNLADKL